MDDSLIFVEKIAKLNLVVLSTALNFLAVQKRESIGERCGYPLVKFLFRFVGKVRKPEVATGDLRKPLVDPFAEIGPEPIPFPIVEQIGLVALVYLAI